jgi:ABC-2 family transporter protein
MVLPLCMSMGLPVFLYQIVLEKETRLIENMKINGMKMSNYWTVNFIFNLGFYLATALIFMFFGMRVFNLVVFTETNTVILFSILLGWGLAQVSMSFLISVFLSKSQTASIVGYTVAVWFTTVASTFNLTIYSPPNEMDWFFYFIPTFTFARLIYYVSVKCGYEHCIAGFNEFNGEMAGCYVALYLSSAFYLILALYLYQVVPQTYGVPKKWNFICKKGKKRDNNQRMRDTDEIGDLEEDRET